MPVHTNGTRPPGPAQPSPREPRTRIAVYCGSRSGPDATYAEAARAVGTELGRRHLDVVYGAGRTGLMGIVAEAALDAGCHVLGVMPHVLAHIEDTHQGLSELRTVADMAERKKHMYDEADGFLTLPGGIGTLEELVEVLSWAALGIHERPIALLDTAGYFQPLLSFLDHSIELGFTRASVRDLLLVDTDPVRLVDTLLGAVHRVERR